MCDTCSGVSLENSCASLASLACGGLCLPFVCLAPMCVSCGFGVVSPDNGCHTQLPTARPARAFAESFAVHIGSLPRPSRRATMRSMLVLCLACCAFGHALGSSLRVERHGLSREGHVDNKAFMLVSGKSGAQEMCLVIADGVRYLLARARGAARPEAACGVARMCAMHVVRRCCPGARILRGRRGRGRWPGVVGDAARGAHRCVACREMPFGAGRFGELK